MQGWNVPYLEGGLTLGQSNAGYANGEPGGPLLTDFGDDSRVLMLAGKPGGSIGSATADVFEPRLVTWFEPQGCGQSPVAMMAFAATQLDRFFGEGERPIVVHASFRGDTGLDELFPGAPHHVHENAKAALVAVKQAAAAEGVRYVLEWIDIIHGESGPYADYAGVFTRYVEQVVDDLTLCLEQEHRPSVIFSQINSFTGAASHNPVVLEQLDAARAMQHKNVFLAGPMYQCPFHDPGHLTDPGRMIHGEVRAHVRSMIRRHGFWYPLWPASSHVERSGRNIVLPMQLPPGTANLAWDDDWVPPVPDRGFRYRDGAHGWIGFESITIRGCDLHLVLDREPREAVGQLDYAIHHGESVFWWASGRGQLYAETDVPSIYGRMGFKVPRSIRHYGVAFTTPVTDPTRPPAATKDIER